MKEPTMPPITYGLAKTDELPRLREIFLQCFGEAAAAEMELVFLRYGNALWCNVSCHAGNACNPRG